VIFVIATCIIVPLILWIVAVAGEWLIPSLVGVSLFLIILINILLPTVILPWFYTFSDLEEGELKKAILEEAKTTEVTVG
jgi:hypothetical protein